MTFEAEEFFKGMLNVSSDYKTLTFKCSNCGKSSLVDIAEGGVTAKSIVGNKSEFFKIDGFNSEIGEGYVRVTLRDDQGGVLFEHDIEAYKPAFSSSATTPEPIPDTGFQFTPETTQTPEPVINSPEQSNEKAEQPASAPAPQARTQKPQQSAKRKNSVKSSIEELPVYSAEEATVLRQIRNGWLAGLIATVIIIATLIFLPTKYYKSDIDVISLDIAMSIGLLLGIYLKSRVCATLMLVYLVFGVTMSIIQNIYALAGIPVAAVFAYFYYKAMIATFRFTKLGTDMRSEKPSSAIVFALTGAVTGAVISIFAYGLIVFFKTGLLSGSISQEIILVALRVSIMNDGAFLTAASGTLIGAVCGFVWSKGHLHSKARDTIYLASLIIAAIYIGVGFVINNELFRFTAIAGLVLWLYLTFILNQMMKKMIPSQA